MILKQCESSVRRRDFQAMSAPAEGWLGRDCGLGPFDLPAPMKPLQEAMNMKSPLTDGTKFLLMLGVILILMLIGICFGQPPQAPAPEQAPPVQWYASLLPEGAERYTPAVRTQSISVLSGYGDQIIPVPIKGLASKWHQSGGMEGIAGVVSEKYRLLPELERSWIGNIPVWNGSNFQDNRGIKREYASGSRFDDVLLHKGKVFEHRVREKKANGRWSSTVIYTDEASRPKGYAGLTVTCASCHNEAGSGGYAVGLVPGGDTVLSDPLNWSLVGGRR